MSNQKTTQLRPLVVGDVVRGDLLPVVDVSSTTGGPTGEMKAITVDNLAKYIISGGFIRWDTPQQGFQTANGLTFDPAITGGGSLNNYCYGAHPPMTTDFSLMVRAFVPVQFVTSSNTRVLFGVSTSPSSSAAAVNNAYIGVQNYDLVAYANQTSIVYADFFRVFKDNTIEVTLTQKYGGSVIL